MEAASDSRMLSSMAACVKPPAGAADTLLCSGRGVGELAARLMLRVFLAALSFSVLQKGFLVSCTGVEARLWLRVFLAGGGPVGVEAALAGRRAVLSRSVPHNGFSGASAKLMLLDFFGALVGVVVSDFLCSTGGVLTDLGCACRVPGKDCFRVRGCSAFKGRVREDRAVRVGLGVEVRS